MAEQFEGQGSLFQLLILRLYVNSPFAVEFASLDLFHNITTMRMQTQAVLYSNELSQHSSKIEKTEKYNQGRYRQVR